MEQKRRRAGGHFFSRAVRRAGGHFFGAEKSAAAIFFYSRKESQIIFGLNQQRKIFSLVFISQQEVLQGSLHDPTNSR